MRVWLSIVAATVTLVTLAACGPEIDRGRCFKSRTEHRAEPAHYDLLLIPDGNGGLTQFWIPQPERNWTETVCELWEFPDGRK
jgi:hypothetical protein